MQLDSSLQSRLDIPTKEFEVSIRCYVADTILRKYQQREKLEEEIENRINSIKNSHAILSGKIASLKKSSPKGREDFWDNLCFAQKCYQNQKHIESHDVAYLKETVTLTYLFKDIFGTLIDSFDNPEDYLHYSSQYCEIRNNLSHRGSYIITKEDALDCIQFMRKGCRVIDETYFWFCSIDKLEQYIRDFEEVLFLKKPIIENINNVPFPTKAIVCREPELAELFKFCCGWDGNRVLRNRKHLICVSGYGGIGKTSLVTEFISRLLNVMQDDNYKGLRPYFILFYSAKTQAVHFDNNSGALYIKKGRPHFSSYDELISKLYDDLSVKEFDDRWDKNGIVVIDNLESLTREDRTKIIEHVDFEFPPCVHVIITTRIPEHADETMSLRGFQNEAGLHFINEYLIQNNVKINLNDEQKNSLIRYSYGNSLVLVLSLTRLASRKVTYNAIINELKQLPRNNADNSISHFMFQNTIEEIYNTHPEHKELIENILTCLSITSENISSYILYLTLPNTSIDEIDFVLQLLTQYLVVEKTGEYYVINEFANRFIITNLAHSTQTHIKLESRLLSAMNSIRNQKMTVEQFKKSYPNLSKVLSEWCGEEESENLAICRAFALYEDKKDVSRGSAAFVIDNLNRQFEQIEAVCSAHPYVFYQWSRILIEMRRDHAIEDEYNDSIIKHYEQCLMMIDTPSFKKIKKTKTYPSILWIYAMFLLSVQSYEKASSFADRAVKNYEALNIQNGDSNDAKLIFAIAEIELFGESYDISHLENARMIEKELSKLSSMPKNVQNHYEELKRKLEKYAKYGRMRRKR